MFHFCRIIGARPMFFIWRLLGDCIHVCFGWLSQSVRGERLTTRCLPMMDNSSAKGKSSREPSVPRLMLPKRPPPVSWRDAILDHPAEEGSIHSLHQVLDMLRNELLSRRARDISENPVLQPSLLPKFQFQCRALWVCSLALAIWNLEQ
jgi:hypothetical protein